MLLMPGPRPALLAATVMCLVAPCSGADRDADALALQTPEDKPTATASSLRTSIEGAHGRGRGQFSGGSVTLGRLSADLVWSTRLDSRWRFVLSDRIDAVDPHSGAGTVNSLRELSLAWQDSDAGWMLEGGRINLRQGPALGYNPTDFFRDGSVRVSTTVNPLLVREYRLGSAMLRVQRLWNGGSASLAVSPKLADAPNSAGFSADLGSTNYRDRMLATLNTQWSGKASTQFHFYQDGSRSQLGASYSGLLGDATVLFAEGTWGRDQAVLSHASGERRLKQAGRVAAGLTYTTPTKLAVTGEIELNGFAISRSERDALKTRPESYGAYLLAADRLQDLAARRALMLYVKQTDIGIRDLDVTALVRWNAQDHSSMTWLELRRRFESFDIALQWLRFRGSVATEFGTVPYRTSWQALISAYF